MPVVGVMNSACWCRWCWQQWKTRCRNNMAKCAMVPKVTSRYQVRGHARWLKPLRHHWIFGVGFLLLLNSNYRHTTHHLATWTCHDMVYRNVPLSMWVKPIKTQLQWQSHFTSLYEIWVNIKHSQCLYPTLSSTVRIQFCPWDVIRLQ